MVIFQQHTLFLCLPVSLLPIKMALDRWQMAWEVVQARALATLPLEPWQEVGFIGHADDYAALALARLGSLQSNNPAAGMDPTGGPRKQYVGEKLDDTSMTHIADLMLKLGNS